VIGPLLAYFFIGISISSAPWFEWSKNALSDLGHALKSESAVYYNFGLAAAGLIIAIYAVTSLMSSAKYSGLSLAASAFSLQLVAVFDEIYGRTHMLVSVIFFVLLLLSSLIYAIEKRSILAGLSFILGFSAWLFYWMKLYSAGVAVPEIISATAAISWIIISALETLRKNDEAKRDQYPSSSIHQPDKTNSQLKTILYKLFKEKNSAARRDCPLRALQTPFISVGIYKRRHIFD